MSGSEKKPFWLKPLDDILEVDPKILGIDILTYLENTETDEITNLEMMNSAVTWIQNEFISIRQSQAESRIKALEDANSMDFMQLAFDLALGAFGGGVIGFVAKSALGKILKSRLLVGTIKHKIRITDSVIDSATRKTQHQRLKIGMVKKKNSYKYSAKRNHYDITMIQSVDLDPNSWERILLEKFPGVIGGRVDEAIQSRGNIQDFSNNKTISLAAFFRNQDITLKRQISNAKKEYTSIKNNIQKKLLNITKAELRKIVEPISEAAKFEHKNKLENILKENNDIEKVILFAQPIIIGVSFQMAIMSSQILPAKREVRQQLKWGSFVSEKAKPERVRANQDQKVALTGISKILLVPELLKKDKLSYFYDHYLGDTYPDRPQVKVTEYFHKIRQDKILVSLQNISLALINYLSNLTRYF